MQRDKDLKALADSIDFKVSKLLRLMTDVDGAEAMGLIITLLDIKEEVKKLRIAIDS